MTSFLVTTLLIGSSVGRGGVEVGLSRAPLSGALLQVKRSPGMW
jgi:hypothetical protein